MALPSAQTLTQALASFPVQERRVLILRYGLKDGRCASTDAVASRLHLSVGQVVWLEQVALTRLSLLGKSRGEVLAETLRVQAQQPAYAAVLLDYARALVPDTTDQDAVSEVLLAIYEGRDPQSAYREHRRRMNALRYNEVDLWSWRTG